MIGLPEYAGSVKRLYEHRYGIYQDRMIFRAMAQALSLNAYYDLMDILPVPHVSITFNIRYESI